MDDEHAAAYQTSVIGLVLTIGVAVPVGFHIGIIAAIADPLKSWCISTLQVEHSVSLSENKIDLLFVCIISTFLLGGCFGSAVAGTMADRIGRKHSFLFCYAFYILGSVLFYVCRYVDVIEILFLGRFVVGIGAGVATTVLPLYLAEAAPLNLRNSLGVCVGIGIAAGIFFAEIFALNSFLSFLRWQEMMTANVILVILCLIPFPWIPESPKYLLNIRKNRALARRELSRLRASSNTILIERELHALEVESQSETVSRSICSILRDPKLSMPIILVFVFQCGQQLSAFNAIFYYWNEIFDGVKFRIFDAKLLIFGGALLNMILSCFSPIFMQRINRRRLIYYSCLLCGLFLAIFFFFMRFIKTFSWFHFVVFNGFIFAYQIALGSMPFFITSELFEFSSRSAAMTLASLFSWIFNLLVAITFPYLFNLIGVAAFILFAFFCWKMLAFLNKYLPETRKKSTVEILSQISNGFKSKIIRE